uniref:armadillo repeat-containing protein 6-like n=1 Tax=Styela clava TaxID=7725 RepID=UPI001939E6C5|nr:armadillo repeat-containing protein 6-like [Styela clava]
MFSRTYYCIRVNSLSVSKAMAETTVLKTISQETFDGVVRENLEEFEMPPEEALSDAIQQFKSQGVNINIIIKEVPQDGKHKVISLILSLSDKVKDDNWEKDSTKLPLLELADELSQDLSKRYQACKATNVTDVLFRCCTMSTEKSCHQLESFKAFSALVNGQPDEATNEHIQFFISNLRECQCASTAEVLCTIFMRISTMQEINRQALVKCGIINILMQSMEKFIDHVNVVRECCGALRALTLDDDVRVPFGQSHEHSKLMVTEHDGLQRFVKALKEHHSDPTIAKEVTSTLSKLMVRNEYCQDFIDLQGFDVLKNMVICHTKNSGVIKQSIDLLQAISRNDDVKIYLMKNGVVDMLLPVLEKYIANPSICESSFAALTTVSLRNPTHSKIIIDSKLSPIIVQAMKVHGKHAGVQRESCMLIRNLVARTREYSPVFIDLGVEELIRSARKHHTSALDDQAKAALRDLDLDVDLKTPWVGAGHGVQR